MSNATNKKFNPEDYLTQEEFRTRFHAEKAKVQRHYCTLFGFWRSCRSKPCRRARACGGDAKTCLESSVHAISRERQFAAREALLRATPRNLAAPERAARAIMAGSFEHPQEAFRPANIPRGWTRKAARPRRRKLTRRAARRESS